MARVSAITLDSDRLAIEQVMRSAKQGMRQCDIEAALAVARKVNCVIMFRAVNPTTAELLNSQHPTKNFHIKAKSSENGPMAGFIPVDQSLSKLAGCSQSKIDKSNNSVRKCLGSLYQEIGKSHIDQKTLNRLIAEKRLRNEGMRVQKDGSKILFVSIKDQQGAEKRIRLQCRSGTTEWCDASAHAYEAPLVLSNERFQQQAELGFYTRRQVDKCYELTATDANGQEQRFMAKPAGKGWAIYYEGGERPVEVLCDTYHHRPLVADYDLHEVMPHIGDYGCLDRLPYSPITPKAHNKINSKHGIGAKELEKIEDPKMGNISPRVRAVVRELNSAMGRGYGLDTVHHNCNAASPFGGLDYPITVMLPRRIGDLPSVLMVNDYPQLVEVMQRCVDQGYVMRNHTNFGKSLYCMRRHSFKNARQSLGGMFSSGGGAASTFSEKADTGVKLGRSVSSKF